MEVKIGILHNQRELTLESEQSPAEVEQALTEALASDGVLVLAEKRGRRILVPAARVAYLDLGSDQIRPVGFGSV